MVYPLAELVSSECRNGASHHYHSRESSEKVDRIVSGKRTEESRKSASKKNVSIASSYGSDVVSDISKKSSLGSVPVVEKCGEVKFRMEESIVLANEVPTTDGGANHDASARFTEWWSEWKASVWATSHEHSRYNTCEAGGVHGIGTAI